MTKLVMCLLVVGLVVAMPNSASAWFIDFENGVDGAPVNGIPGISFQDFNGYTSLYGDSRTGTYNTYSDNLGQGWGGQGYHHNGYFWLWAGQEADARGVIVDFTNNDGTYFRTGYSSASPFYLTAYLTDNSTVDVAGGANTNSPMGFLTVNATAGTHIDRVVLHDTGNQWLTDDMSGDATGIPGSVPEPGTLVLFGVMAAGLGFIGRKRRRV